MLATEVSQKLGLGLTFGCSLFDNVVGDGEKVTFTYSQTATHIAFGRHCEYNQISKYSLMATVLSVDLLCKEAHHQM